ncbi:hypothetical protein G3I51_13460 [Streptomyces sp. SID9944]|nr:hypothetical protein [Streptomyces sp. SID9944]
MSAFAAALAGAITAVGVGSVAVARSWPERGTGRHRAARPVERLAALLQQTEPTTLEEAK